MNLSPAPTQAALFLLALSCSACAKEPVAPVAARPIAAQPIAAPEVAAAPDLLARRQLPLGARPLAVLARDFDADGFDDLAVAVESPGELLLFAGGPEGLSERGAALAIGDFPTNLCEAGGQLFVGSKATGELLAIDVFREADELVARRAWTAQPGGMPRSIAAGCLAGSDAVRVLWATRDDRVLLVARVGSPGMLELEHGARPVEMCLAADGTGFALLCQGTSDIRLYDVDASGVPSERRRVALDGVPRSAAEADLDGDGDLETVFVGGDDHVLVFGLGVAGGFAAGEPLRTTQPSLVAAALAHHDLDGDGREELVSLGLIDQGYSVLGDFAGGAPAVRISEYAGQDPWDLALGDFDGDGRVDLAVANRAANALSLLGGTGIVRASKPAFYQATRVGVGTNPLSIAAADLCGPGGAPCDGRPEVATLDASDGMLSLLVNDGYGSLSLGARLPVGPSPRGLSPLAIGPGQAALVALVVPSGQSGRLVAFGPNPAGFGPLGVRLVGPSAAQPLGPSGEAQLAIGDLDGDGHDDLVLADPVRPELRVLFARGLDSGAVVFEAKPPITLTGIASAVAVVARPEGPRLAVALGLEIQLLSLSGETLDRLAAPAAARAGRGCSRLVAADLSGDGYDDLGALWLGPQGTSPGWVATTTLAPGMRVSFELPTGLAPADLGASDLNGDGRAELFVAAQNSHLVDLWSNRGDEGFRLAPPIGVGLGPLDVVAVDLIGKGRPDLAVANAFSSDVSVIYNRPRAPR